MVGRGILLWIWVEIGCFGGGFCRFGGTGVCWEVCGFAGWVGSG